MIEQSESAYIEKAILEIFVSAGITKLKPRWDANLSKFEIKGDILTPSNIPQMERVIHSTLRGSSFYYKSVKHLYGRTYGFIIFIKPSVKPVIQSGEQ